MADLTLILFLSTSRVDPYVNAIAYAFDRLHITAVKLVYVSGSTTGLTVSEAADVSNAIWNRVSQLSATAEVYHRLHERLLDRHVKQVDYTNLKSEFAQLVQTQHGPKRCIVDLSGASKAASLDIFSACLAIGVSRVHVFELRNPADPSAPEKSLYHSLDVADYSYTCITDSPPVQASRTSLLRTSTLAWQVGFGAIGLLALTLLLALALGWDSLWLQVLNLTAAVVSVLSPLLAYLQYRQV